MLRKRSETAEIDKWSIEDLFETDEHWQMAYEACAGETEKARTYKGQLAESADMLHECLKFADEASEKAGRVYVYAYMRFYEDSTQTFYQSLKDKAQSMYTQLSAALSFIEPEIMKIGAVILEEWLDAHEGLGLYRFYIKDKLRMKEHILPAEMEELLSKAAEIGFASEDIFMMLNNADMTFNPVTNSEGESVEITHGTYISLMESSDRVLRKNVFEEYYQTYMKHKHTLAATTSANIKKDIFFSRARGYGSALDAALFNNNIPKDVYISLIETVHEYLPDMHRYIELRKRLLGVETLHMYDLYTPLIPVKKREILFDEGCDIVAKSLQPLGDEYIRVLQKGFDSRWIDKYENEGKRGGAFAWGAYGSHPFVFLNYDNTLSSVFTLAHEMGHALHFYYSWENQPYVYSDTSIFLAEVASTANEAILTDYLLKNTDDKEERRFIINQNLDDFRTTLFRQTMFAEFEMLTHDMAEKGNPITLDALNELYRALNIKYYGPSIEVDSLSDIEWARIPHFYTAFYVYQYATGFSAAMALSQRILKEGAQAVKDYIAFLKAGGSAYSIDILKDAGVDMRTPQPVRNALDVFGRLVGELGVTLN